MAAAIGRGQHADVVEARGAAAEILPGPGLVRDSPAAGEVRAQPGAAGARLRHRLDQPLRRRGREQIALHQPRESSDEHTSELQSLMRNTSALFCLQKYIYQKT